MRKYIKHWLGLTGILAAAIGMTACSGSDGDNTTSDSSSDTLVIVSFGGALQDAQEEAFMKPFMEKKGVEIRQEQWSGSLAQIKAMVDTNNVTWDLVDIEADVLYKGVEEGLFEEIDASKLPQDEMLEDSIYSHGVAGFYWSTVMGYNSENYNEDNPPPANWSEFWDVENFPGDRTLRDAPVGNLEFALLADGVNPDELYPLDVDRAFASLDKIKPHITLWWEAGAEPATALADGEVVLGSAYSGRLQTKIDDDQPVAINWQGGALNRDLWVIPKGSPNKDLAMEFIAFASQADKQSAFAKQIAYGPVNVLSIDNLPEETIVTLPSAEQNLEKQFVIDIKWWSENLDEMLMRWDEWKLQ